MDNKKKSVAQERKISCYPSPQIIQKIENYAADKEMSKSAVVKEALRSFFEVKKHKI